MNTIIITKGILKDGSVIEYDFRNEEHVNSKRFYQISDNENLDRFEVITDEGTYGVDLETGAFYVNDETFPQDTPDTRLRLIHYRDAIRDYGMTAQDGDLVLELLQPATSRFFVVGWQTTINNTNVRKGLKIYNDRYEITSEI